MTLKQEDVLAFIRRYVAEHGAFPAYAKISARFGFKYARVLDILLSLSALGHVRVKSVNGWGRSGQYDWALVTKAERGSA